MKDNLFEIFLIIAVVCLTIIICCLIASDTYKNTHTISVNYSNNQTFPSDYMDINKG